MSPIPMSNTARWAAGFLATLMMLSASAASASETRLLRFPDICAGQVAFVQAGDLHIVSASGGVARRLTEHEGTELYPKFSPDCRQIAFSAEFDGTRQVHVIDTHGGQARQLTWYNDAGPLPLRAGSDYRVLDWTPDGQQVLVLANRTAHGNRLGRPYLVPLAGGTERALPMPESGGGMLSPDGRHLVYTPIDNDFRGWKRYRGGRAPDIWTYDLVGNTARRLTDHRASDAQPMWLGDTIYFVSDRDGTANLYALGPDAKAPEQLTRFDDLDVLWPSAGSDAIVFERDGWLWRFDPRARRATRLAIQVPDPFRHAKARRKALSPYVDSFAMDPKGEHVVFGARGKVMHMNMKSGAVANLTVTTAAREHGVAIAPDGQSVAYLSDASGEYELYVRSLRNGSERQLTRGGDVWKFAPTWSPDGRHLAYADHARRLHVVEVATARTTEVDRGTVGDLTEYTWSPDGRWLAYTRRNAEQLDQVLLYSLENGLRQVATEAISSAFGPAFDPGGRWLYVFSKRDTALTMSAYEENFVPAAATRLYAIALAADAPSWIAQASHDAASMPVRVEPEGLVDRIEALPVAPGNYRKLHATRQALFFLSGNDEDAESDRLELRTIALGGKQDEPIVEHVRDYAMSGDGSRILARRSDAFSALPASPQQAFESGLVDLAALTAVIEPRAEWRQSFDDAWRIVRDWFYDPDMHGGMARWKALRSRYTEWAAQAAHRGDLDYALHELLGELHASHLYVQAGDQPAVPRREGGLLGAEIVSDPTGYFRIDRIFRGDPANANARSPLERLADDGEYILAIDGTDARTVRNIYALLQGKGGKDVRVRLNASAGEEGAREAVVRTITSEHGLRNLAWVRERRALVDRLSKGRVGYIHLPNTGASGYGALLRGLAAYHRKEALIIDDRYNGGGLVPDRMIELLARRPLKRWQRRDQPLQSTPQLAHDGPKAMLINAHSASGGDTLAHYFRLLGLGPLVGTRTWGGTIAVDGNPTLVDGGQVQVASARSQALDGAWVIENEGVVPDIEAIDAPDRQAAGDDPSLETAVSLLLDTLGRSDTTTGRSARAPTAHDAPRAGSARQ